jgi:hypothetical protein
VLHLSLKAIEIVRSEHICHFGLSHRLLRISNSSISGFMLCPWSVGISIKTILDDLILKILSIVSFGIIRLKGDLSVVLIDFGFRSGLALLKVACLSAFEFNVI